MAGYLALRADNLLAAFGAGNAVPGSGSAAAFAGGLAANLGRTVCLKSREHQAGGASRLDYLQSQLEGAAGKLAELLEQDSFIFGEVVELRVRHKRTDDRTEAGKLARLANDRLEDTSDVIFAIADECLRVAEFSISLFKEGWHAVRGDSGAAISCALAGAMSCVFVSRVNARKLRNREAVSAAIQRRAERLSERIESLQRTAWECAAELVLDSPSTGETSQ